MGKGVTEWYESYPQGPWVAELKKRSTGNVCKNRFDQLSIYFQVKLYDK